MIKIMNSKSKKNTQRHQINPQGFSNPQSKYWILLGLILIGALTAPVLGFDFVNWDDNVYVYENSILSSDGLAYIWNPIQGNFHPLTQLTLYLNYLSGGLNPVGYHAINWVLHLSNVYLIWVLIGFFPGTTLQKIWIPLAFGLHPFHVESYAWVSERKDVLYAFFTLISCICWIRAEDNSKKINQVGMILALWAALLSKPMAVTTPFLWIMLTGVQYGFQGIRKRLQEQGVLLSMGLGSCLALAGYTIYAQYHTGAIRSSTTGFGPEDNLFIACRGLLFYFLKTLIPWGLSPLYPYPIKTQGYLPMVWYLTPIIIGILGVILYRFREKLKVFNWGILIWITCLLPVIQLIPAGSAVAADRYMYLGILGLLIAFSSLIPWNSLGGKIGAFGILIVWSGLTFQQQKVWKNGETLHRGILKEYPQEPVAMNNLGVWLEDHAKEKDACVWYEKAVKIKPDFSEAIFNFAVCKYKNQEWKEAIRLNKLALRYDSLNPEIWNNLGTCLGATGDSISSYQALQKAIQLNPKYSEAWNNLGMLAAMSQNWPLALQHFTQASQLASATYLDPLHNMRLVHLQMGDSVEAAKIQDQLNRLKTK
jgi:Flp pilus assembly protein TadD